MSQYLDFDGLTLYDKNVKKRTSEGYYNKDEVDNLLSQIETNILWKDAVATYSDIATTYPYPQEGWTVTVLDTNETYRYDGDNWVKISAGSVPKATATNDGLMPKEMYVAVDSMGSAASKNATTTVDQSTNLPTASAVQTYVASAVAQTSEALIALINDKVSKSDVGDASERNYTDLIPEETEKIRVYGEWYSDSDNMFYLKGTGVDDGIDLSFIEDMNNYILHFNLLNYSSSVAPKLHVTGTKEVGGEIVTIDTYYQEGDTLVLDNIPDEYISGEDSGALEVFVSDYEASTIIDLDFLIFPVLYDEGNDENIALLDTELYETQQIVHQEFDVLADEHIVYGIFGMYSSSDLPTSTAVSNLVRVVADALQDTLNDRIDEVEEKIDDYEEASDEDIESLFDFGDDDSDDDTDATDEDIENLFSL